MIDLAELERTALSDLARARTRAEVERWRAEYLGRRSGLAGLLGSLGALPADLRPGLGQKANGVKARLEAAFDEHARAMPGEAQERAVDTSLPGRRAGGGRLHPTTSTRRRMLAAFAQMGFQAYQGRDVETDAYNFSLLNVPPYHPARDSHDTFYTARLGVLLRTHTSPAQLRVMHQTGAPVRAVVPGACYRVDQPDASHNWMFYQMEGFAVGKRVQMSDLLGAIAGLVRVLFGREVRVRFRSSYFPFTEPSIETDVSCTVCGGKGCRLCKGSGWVEVIPGGMIHPTVLRNGGVDPKEHTGFAFGAGIDRMAALWYRIPDIRLLYEDDLRFLQQF